jgi:hypothetical protein
MEFNRAQLSTYREAQQIARKIGATGGGVSEIVSLPNQGSEEGCPQVWYFRFHGSPTLHNVGLIREQMASTPESWRARLEDRVRLSHRVATEVDTAAEKRKEKKDIPE